MRLYLVHHADAVGPGVDSQRPLSPRGLAQAAWLAAEARGRGTRPALIWHSGKLRSRQTAEQFLRSCSPSAVFRAARGLLPEDPTVWMEDALSLEEQDVLVVGHFPQLPALARVLGASDPLPLNGMMAFERTASMKYEQQWFLEPPRDLPEHTNGRPDDPGRPFGDR
jgi:phosphohistidine phosphatase